MSNFILKCLSGDALLEDVDDYVERWHEGASTLSLCKYLGMSRSEYELWVIDPDVLPFVVEAHRTHRDVNEVIEEFNALPLAARAASPERARKLATWLKNAGLWE
ncbi:conserved hypothetical protein [Candidatus Contendobacter odensis Run_B_J11]|uniref:Uncharacterized protein n=2 Tax=Candidatus Contendibacter odensensis TaxID=1400860 RepID=A0A7U7GCB4_9GAMM|nr:conserved hypothetical protein [Candidatus Contendobacter odensis Run_B_J11]